MARTPTILIIDDDPDFIESLRMVLETCPIRVLSAGSSEEGMCGVERERPDLILLDIMMPEGTEGLHFVWKLRRHHREALRRIPVVIITSIHHTIDLRLYPDQRDTSYGDGEFLPVQGFLDKPIKPGELLNLVNRFV